MTLQAGVMGLMALQPGASTGRQQAWDGESHENPASGNTRNWQDLLKGNRGLKK